MAKRRTQYFDCTNCEFDCCDESDRPCISCPQACFGAETDSDGIIVHYDDCLCTQPVTREEKKNKQCKYFKEKK